MIKGFFKPIAVTASKPVVTDENGKVVKTRVRSKDGVARVARKTKTFDCSGCSLSKNKLSVTGEGKRGIYIVTDFPSTQDITYNRHLSGNEGNTLREKLRYFGINLEEDCWLDCAVACALPSDRKKKEPTSNELKCCWSRLEQNILDKNPKQIWLMGEFAFDTFYDKRDIEKKAFMSWVKRSIPDRKYNCWVLPQLSPLDIVESKKKDEYFKAFNDHCLKFAASCIGQEPPVFEDYLSKVEVLTDYNKIVSLLQHVLDIKPKIFIFDYETNSKKPYWDISRILTTSFYLEETEKAYSFPIDYPGCWTPEQVFTIKELWCDILFDPEIWKSAHNLKFEHLWTDVVLDTEVQGWLSCTMNNAHIIDSRDGITGLKVQAFLEFGVEGYEKEIKPYMEEDPVTHKNKLDTFPLDKLLLYGGIDSLLEYWLYRRQIEVFNRIPSLAKCRDLFTDGILALADMEKEGIPINKEYYDNIVKELTKEQNQIFNWLRMCDEAKKFEQQIGKTIDYGESGCGITKDMKTLLFEVLKIKSGKKTEKGNMSVDDEVLSKMNTDFSLKFLRARKIKKMLEYVGQYISGQVDGRLHPNFSLNIARTGRSSSSDPNFQNIPKRDKEAKKVIRSGIIPAPGYILMEVDYAQLEVRGNAMYSGDPALIHYINTSPGGMHIDVAADIFFKEPSEITSDLKHYGKNGFVFAQFYGDYYVHCAQGIWGDLISKNHPILEHLAKNGITTYDSFEKHMKWVEDKFWAKLNVTKQWRDKVIDFYKRRGYVDSFFGFRGYGYLRRNQIINMPVQGGCFHMLLWAATQLKEIQRVEKWKTRMNGQIHDALVFHVYKPEREHVVKTVDYVMCHKIREVHPFIITPLAADFTFYDESWYSEMKEAQEEEDNYFSNENGDGFSLQKSKPLF